jgi:hypothetical protein
MGCDYYIIKQLCVQYIAPNGAEGTTTIEIDRERAYFFVGRMSDNDSDDDDYAERLRAYYERELRVTYVPRILCTDGVWRNDAVKSRYSNMIHESIGAGAKIMSVKKEEVRRMR